MGLTHKQVRKVCEKAGYDVVDIQQGKHLHITVTRGGKSATVTLSVSPRSDFWPTWLLADIKRAMRQESGHETSIAEQNV